MFHFLIVCGLYVKSKLFIAFILRLHVPGKMIRALTTQKFVNKSIRPHSPAKYARKSASIFNYRFSNFYASASQNMHLKYFACWELMTLTPFNNSFSFFCNLHIYFEKLDIIQRHCR